MPVAAFVAVTAHVAAPVARTLASTTLQLVPVAAYVTAPDPDPPAAVSAIGVPDTPAVDVLLTVTAAWVAPANVNTLPTLVADA